MESKKINQLATNLAPVSTDLTIVGDPVTGVSKKITLSQIANLFAGQIDFYANLAAFPATGTLNTIFCAKDTQKLYLWSGSAYVEVFPSQAVLNTYQLLSAKGVANGYASLDASGKVPIGELPSSIMEYKGLWSAATNTPTLANGTGDTGDVYISSSSGSVNFGAGAITFAIGDYCIYSGTIWQRSSGAVGTVTSVGLSSATSGVTIGSSPITTSGTITLAIATATTSQNGLLSSTDWATFNAKQNAITLTTTGTSGASTLIGATLNIPNYGSALTGYVPYTGATQDVDLGAFKLNAQSLHAKGTAGNGHLGLKHQSASATASANEVSLFADSLGDLGWQNGNLYLSKFITSGNTAARSYTFPNATGTIALTSDLTGYLTAVTATSPLSSSGGVTPNITIALATTSANGYLSSTDWNTFNGKQAALSGTGFVKIAGTTISYDNNTYALDSAVVHNTGAETINGLKTFGVYTTHEQGALIKHGINLLQVGYTGIGASTLGLVIGCAGGGLANLNFNNTTNYTYTFPAATGTLALTSDIHAAVTIGTANGLSLSGQVLSLALATTSVTGALSSTDWTTFNNKQSTVTLTTTGTSGAATFTSNTLNIPNYGSALSGYLPLSGGTLTGALTGTSATFSGVVNGLQGIFKNSGISSIYAYRDLDVTIVGPAGQGIEFGARNGATTFVSGAAIYGVLENPATTGSMVFQTLTASSLTTKLTIDSTGAATFSGNVIVGGGTTTTSKLSILATTGVVAPGSPTLGIYDASNPTYGFDFDLEGVATGDLYLSRLVAGTRTAVLQLARATGAATFSGNVIINKTGTLGNEVPFAINTLDGGAGSQSIQLGGYGSGNALTTGIKLKAIYNYGAASSTSFALQVTNSSGVLTDALTIASSGAATFSSTIKTAAPSGGTAKNWLLGQDTNTLYTATRTIQVEVEGGTYYLLAVKSTDL